jgi:L-rhamnose mutarotase
MKRIAMTVMLKDDPEVIRKYEQYHADPWPEVVEGGYKMGIRRVFIYRFGRQLFMFLETLDDFDMERDAAEYFKDPKTREWDELMRDFQEPVPGAPEGAKWVEMKEIHAIEHDM